MSSPTTYTLLVAQIQDVAEDDSSEFVAYIPNAINLAEDRLFRLVDEDFSKVDSTVDTIDGDPLVTKPTDLRVTHNIWITYSGERTKLWKRTEAFCRDYWPSTTAKDAPKYYAEYDQTRWLLAPTPNAAYDLTIEYEYKPTYLSGSNASNIYSTKYPDLLFYAAMSNAAEWMKDPEGKAEWEAKLSEALGSANVETERVRADDGVSTNTPTKGRNTKV